MTVSDDKLLEMYRDMWRMRTLENRLEENHKKGLVPGFFHSGVGQEASLVGCAHALEKTDYFFPDHRSHGLILIAGTPGEKVMAELHGKATGICGGKGGSLHMADPSVGNLGNNAIQGSIAATALGPAFASQMRKDGRVSAVFLGDGTMGRGEVYESVNLATIWKLPVIYVCLNNLYAISLRVQDAFVPEDLAELVSGFGIERRVADGNDIEVVYDTMAEAVGRGRKGEGPTFIEFKTYRWQGHFGGDPDADRPEEEKRYWIEERDPIKLAGTALVKRGAASEPDLERIKAEVDDEVQGWVDYALASPLPDLSAATDHVYVGLEVAGR
jgi:TPP-dependent pyruvate/acetoin dehydrogenase alpha subunit